MTLHSIIETLGARLGDVDRPVAGIGDDELRSTYPKPTSYREAAVLVPLVQCEDGVHVIFIERAADLQYHPSQIAFPGGRAEPGDADRVMTALREAGEEIALPARDVRVLGTLPTYPTRSGFIITPVIGVLHSLPPLVPDPNEVAAAFTMPLHLFTTPGSHRIDRLLFDGYTHEFYAFDTPRGLVWGATAGILVNLANLLR